MDVLSWMRINAGDRDLAISALRVMAQCVKDD